MKRLLYIDFRNVTKSKPNEKNEMNTLQILQMKKENENMKGKPNEKSMIETKLQQGII